ncbi:uncharacterized protein LOC106013073 [Aplysia californica]|uniref:Uncharacterized protein LOC106013073 n=1 Tax=Aplysia californica TaxID=6500 RepID=A0ABM1A9B5_APLCA|nr:uncharacterized protein LOC106013073 [Aplysia californica]
MEVAGSFEKRVRRGLLVVLVMAFAAGGTGVGALVDKNDFEIGSPLTISCSVKTVPQIPDLGNTISKITLDRTAGGKEQLLATYHPTNPFQKYKEVTSISGGVYEMTGGQDGNIVSNANSIVLKLTIDPAQAGDAAMYKCTFYYYDTDYNEEVVAFTDNATAVGVLS